MEILIIPLRNYDRIRTSNKRSFLLIVFNLVVIFWVLADELMIQSLVLFVQIFHPTSLLDFQLVFEDLLFL